MLFTIPWVATDRGREVGPLFAVLRIAVGCGWAAGASFAVLEVSTGWGSTPLSVFHSVNMVQLLVAFVHWQWSS